MTLDAFKQLELDENSKVVRFSLGPLPCSSSLHMFLQNICIDTGVTNGLK